MIHHDWEAALAAALARGGFTEGDCAAVESSELLFDCGLTVRDVMTSRAFDLGCEMADAVSRGDVLGARVAYAAVRAYAGGSR